MRRLKIDMLELETAFEDNFPEHSSFLDTETGKVVLVTDETRHKMQDFPEKEGETQEDKEARFLEWAKQNACAEWEIEFLQQVYEVENAPEGRFVEIPQPDSSEDYRDMVDFADTVEEEHLENLLRVALDGRGAFRRFKDVLVGFPKERERWFAYKQERLKERIREWLEWQEIELLQ